MKSIGRAVVLGGYGMAGQPICRLLLQHTELDIVIAGRSPERSRAFADQLAQPERVSTAAVDAESSGDLASILRPGDLLLAASSTSRFTQQLIDACLASQADYYDIALSTTKLEVLRERAAEIEAAGMCAITDGGFHPGVPAALVRLAAARLPHLALARVSSVIAVDWEPLQLSASTLDEMMNEFTGFDMSEFTAGSWHRSRFWASPRRFDFGEPFGERPATAMGLAEMKALPDMIPTLQDTGFYVGGFNPVVDYGVLPVALLGMTMAPDLCRRPMGRLFRWGLDRFTRPPYLTELMLEALTEPTSGPSGYGYREALRIRMRHPDAYRMTAAPVVAGVRQLLTGARVPGVHFQAHIVEPEAFLSDLAQMGIGMEWEIWTV